MDTDFEAAGDWQSTKFATKVGEAFALNMYPADRDRDPGAPRRGSA
jgi:hypothetical protein